MFKNRNFQNREYSGIESTDKGQNFDSSSDDQNSEPVNDNRNPDEMLSEFKQAIEYKKSGNIIESAEILERLCRQPNGTGYIGELSLIWRKLNKESLNKEDYRLVIDRVKRMIGYQKRVFNEQHNRWQNEIKREPPKDWFERYRIIKISDAKALLKASKAVSDGESQKIAEDLINQFNNRDVSLKLSQKSIHTQCKELEIPLIELDIPTNKDSTHAAYEYYTSQGYLGAFCEGGAILTIIKALTIDILEKYSKRGREFAITSFLEGLFELVRNPPKDYERQIDPEIFLNEIVEAIQSTSKEKFLENFDEIISDAFVSKTYPGLTLPFASAFVDAVERGDLVNITKKFYTDPYTYRAGWPDLTLVKGEEIKFVEAKKNDSLNRKQLRTINDMKSLTRSKFFVVLLK